MGKCMGRKHRKKGNVLFGLANVKRCLFAALVSVVVFPVCLLLSLLEPGFAEAYLIPTAFFSIGSGAFAYLLHQVGKHKMKLYYDVVFWVYLAAFHLFFIYLAQTSLLFYYMVVVLAAYLVVLSLDQYILMVLGELVCFAALVVKSGVTQIPADQLFFLAGIHLFAFVLSRDFYHTKKNFQVEEKRLRKERHESEHDPLTGLMNRRGLERCVEENWEKEGKHQDVVAVCVIDIDLFKSYNDRFGHVQGDVCIRRVAHSIMDTVKSCGIAARIGGEEFLVFMRCTGVQKAYAMAEQIRGNVEQMQIGRGTSDGAPVTVSIGLDIRYVTEEVNLQGLYGRADQALYRAKQEGRNCVRSSQDFSERRVKTG